MATTNYIDAKIYVQNDDNLVYVVKSVTSYNNGCNYLQINLKLVAGLDYVNPDYSDVQGWCPADNFDKEYQEDYIYQYFIEESMTEALEDNGYKVMEYVPYSIKIFNKDVG